MFDALSTFWNDAQTLIVFPDFAVHFIRFICQSTFSQ